MRSWKPDPLAADIVHVAEDRRNGAGLVFAGRFGSPGGRVKMFDKNLVHALIGGKDLDCGTAELSVNLGLRRSHGSLLLHLWFEPSGLSHLSATVRLDIGSLRPRWTPEPIVFMGDTAKPLSRQYLVVVACELLQQFTCFQPFASFFGFSNVFKCHLKNRCTVPSAIRAGLSTGSRRLSRTWSAKAFCPNG